MPAPREMERRINTPLFERRAQSGERSGCWRWEGEGRGLIFPDTCHRPPDARTIVKQFIRHLQRAGLPDIRFHDLRHSCSLAVPRPG